MTNFSGDPKNLTLSFDDEFTSLCGRSYEDVHAFLEFWMDGVCVSAIGIFGLVGNVLSILTISTMSKLKLFYKLILTLAIFDLLFITYGGVFMAQQAFKFRSTVYDALFPHIIYPGSGFSMTGSTYTCLAITVERFFGICHPNSTTLNRRFRYYVLAILTVCVLIDAPRFLEIKTVMTEKGVEFSYSRLRTHPNYILVYTMWYRLFATAAIPFGLTLFFNIRVLIYCKKNNLQTQSNHERSLLIIFACITITFLFCHIPRVILNIYEFTLQRKEAFCNETFSAPFNPPLTVLLANSVEKLLLILNSSVNFVYYCFSGNRFRNQFCRIFKCCFGSGSNMRQSTILAPSSSVDMRSNHFSTRYRRGRIHQFSQPQEFSDEKASTIQKEIIVSISNGDRFDADLRERRSRMMFLGQYYQETLI